MQVSEVSERPEFHYRKWQEVLDLVEQGKTICITPEEGERINTMRAALSAVATRRFGRNKIAARKHNGSLYVFLKE